MSGVKRMSAPMEKYASGKWLLAGFGLTAWYLWLYLAQAFSGDFVVQDDARQHVFWAYRYLQPGYFLNDLMADYFEAMAPYGYRALYRAAAYLDFDPFVFNKLLPIALAMATTYYCFRLSLRLLPSPAVALVATVLLNQLVWSHDDLPSGTPRAFVYPLLLASFFYIASRSFWPLLLTLILEAAFYPHALLISFATYLFGLVGWEGRKFSLSSLSRDYGAVLVSAAVSFTVLLPYVLKSGDFGPLVTAAEARHLPEFQSGERSAFFEEGFWDFWVKGRRSGFWPTGMGSAASVCLVLSLPLPYLLRRKQTFTLLKSLTPAAGLLPRLAAASLLLFGAAHLLLFRLHLPSRFTQHSFRIIAALAGAMALVAVARVLCHKIKFGEHKEVASKVGSALLLASFAAFLIYPQIRWAAGKEVVRAAFKIGKKPDLYRFLQTQPRDSRVAVLSDEASVIPSFALRSVVFANEYAIAYHRGYYQGLKAREKAMEAAFLTGDPEQLKAFIVTFAVTHFIVDDTVRELWRTHRNGTGAPRLQLAMPRCILFDGTATVVDAHCALR
ncbi:MAG: hypothetical protein ACU84H_03170 [Gammaproteobacteria bacterium]